MLDSSYVDAFQFAGQDIPWLLSHWARNKPDHPFLIWEPKDGIEKRWTYAEFDAEAANIAAGLAAKGVAKGDKILIHSDNCPEMVLAWYACAKIGAVGVTTNTRSAGAEIAYFAEHTRCVGAITQPRYASIVAENAKQVGWIVVSACAPRRSDGARRNHVYLRHDFTPEGRRTHACQCTLGQPDGPDQHRHGDGRHLPRLSAVLSRQRAELVVLDDPRSWRHDRLAAEILGEPVLGSRAQT
jgi:non-ribosomal peptide synthetase component F